ncbi:MAG: hypothetical protein AUJ74_07745 [Candidatus Omnitrophica bacterium CG1_02_44_16]|nr:MAG: hypothetical protein AUJ74_07745 [Candidatus Omnitrophica bacterium CG1_02_44_16]PIY81982.1 MAG: hypothetical protein COY78_08980 [Candidatus Omnitrophica bacterium CG_4_10_14_0_8_um_filter_44_12]PIZ84101.1 MAG: hypothetical protein COX96_05585 [Candidatus Omnitrophica bacterium CG_4_10_14_0_2_um_filter_44_9]
MPRNSSIFEKNDGNSIKTRLKKVARVEKTITNALKSKSAIINLDLLYQKYSEKVKELSVLGMSLRAIGKSLKVSKRMVTKALEFQKM